MIGRDYRHVAENREPLYKLRGRALHDTFLAGDPVSAMRAKLLRRKDDLLTDEGVIAALGWLMRLETPLKNYRLLAINKVSMTAVALFYRGLGGPIWSPLTWPEIDPASFMCDEAIDALFLDGLRDELRKRGEESGGKRSELVKRLKGAVKKSTIRRLPGLELNSLGVVTNLALPHNNLNGTIHRDVFSTKVMNCVKVLDLGENKGISGSIPSTVGLLRLCHTLLLNDCSLSGSIPNGISTMLQLKVLDLSRNKLTGALPSRLLDLKQLREMNVSWNK